MKPATFRNAALAAMFLLPVAAPPAAAHPQTAAVVVTYLVQDDWLDVVTPADWQCNVSQNQGGYNVNVYCSPPERPVGARWTCTSAAVEVEAVAALGNLTARAKCTGGSYGSGCTATYTAVLGPVCSDAYQAGGDHGMFSPGTACHLRWAGVMVRAVARCEVTVTHRA